MNRSRKLQTIVNHLQSSADRNEWPKPDYIE